LILIDIRYHVTSLISVFLALAIGIIMGSSMAPGVSTKVLKVVKDQNAQVNQVLDEYKRDHDLLSKMGAAMDDIAPEYLNGLLTDKRVAIIQTGEQSDSTNEATKAIEMAGGEVVSVTTLTSGFDDLDDDDYVRIRNSMIQLPTTNDPVMDTYRPLSLMLASGAQAGSEADLGLSVLKRERLIETSGDYSKPVSLVVVVDGDDISSANSPLKFSNRVDALLNVLPNQGALTVVGCESLSSLSSSVSAYRNAGYSSVDCIDEAVGKIDLVYALNGHKGTYGLKVTADTALPDSIAPNRKSHLKARDSH